MSDPTKPQWGRKNWLLLPFALLWITLLLWNVDREVRAYQSRQVIRTFLDKPDSEFLVTVNHNADSRDNEVLRAVRSIDWRTPNHSHPTHEIPLVIRNKQSSLELTLARDWADPDEYWVFWTRQERDPNRLDIGSIKTSVFNGN